MPAQSQTTTPRRAKTPTRSKATSAVPAPALEADKAPPGPKGKLGAVILLLRRPDGAPLSELMATTGWQAHSVRGAIAGALKKKLGLTITSEKTPSGRTYRIVGAGAEG